MYIEKLGTEESTDGNFVIFGKWQKEFRIWLVRNKNSKIGECTTDEDDKGCVVITTNLTHDDSNFQVVEREDEPDSFFIIDYSDFELAQRLAEFTETLKV